jgi:hypothetical protein
MTISTALQAAHVIAKHREKQIQVAARKMVRQTRKQPHTGPQLWSERASWLYRVDELKLPTAAKRLVTRTPTLDLSPAAVDERQRKIVGLLCAGHRISLRRAWKACGYAEHHLSLKHFLESPTIRALFLEHLEAGDPLPIKFRSRILASLGITEEDIELGFVGKAKPP